MIYVIAAIIGISIGICCVKDCGDRAWGIAGCIIVLCLVIGFLINGVIAVFSKHEIMEVTEVPLGINPVTNQYFVVTEEGEILTNDDIIFTYSISKDISEPIVKQYITKKDLGIWGFDDISYDYHIIIPTT